MTQAPFECFGRIRLPLKQLPLMLPTRQAPMQASSLTTLRLCLSTLCGVRLRLAASAAPPSRTITLGFARTMLPPTPDVDPKTLLSSL